MSDDLPVWAVFHVPGSCQHNLFCYFQLLTPWVPSCFQQVPGSLDSEDLDLEITWGKKTVDCFVNCH